MPHIAARIDAKTLRRIESYCCHHNGMSKTPFLLDALNEKLLGDIIGGADEWKTNAASMLGLTIGQLNYAIMQSLNTVEAFARINDKCDPFNIYPFTSDGKIILQVTRKDGATEGKLMLLTIDASGSKTDSVIKLLKQLEDKIAGEIDYEKIDN
jgi:hypothetical protein